MTSTDGADDLPAASQAEAAYVRPLVLFSLVFCAMLAVGALIVTGAADGWRVAAELISRFSVVIFAAWLGVEPLAGIFPGKFMGAAAREHDRLLFAFVSAFAMSLVCVLIPVVLGGTQFAISAIFYCGLNGAVLAVLLSSFRPAAVGRMSARTWRALQRVATAYYWLAFTMWDLGRLGTSGRLDGWYEFSLFLLTGVVLVRLAGWFVARQRGRQLAVKVA